MDANLIEPYFPELRGGVVLAACVFFMHCAIAQLAKAFCAHELASRGAGRVAGGSSASGTVNESLAGRGWHGDASWRARFGYHLSVQRSAGTSKACVREWDEEWAPRE